ncbi:MAG: flagellar basal body-associated FliL family protein [Vampirovibrionales bacterium]
MARPTKAKDIKPEDIDLASGSTDAPAISASGLDIKFIVTIVAILIAGIGGSVASTLFLAPIALGPVVAQQVQSAMGGEHGKKEGEAGEEGASHGSPAQTIGLRMDLDEFTVNLQADPNIKGNQFLRTKMTLNIGVPEEEYCDPTGGHGEKHASVAVRDVIASGGRVAGGQLLGAAASTVPLPMGGKAKLIANGGGEAADPYKTCTDAFAKNMTPYGPTIRDIINQSLMKRTAGTLATIEGQELLKDDIKAQINSLIGPKYSVIRVNFSDFIIQY